MKPCAGCLRITEHDLMPGNRTFPSWLCCSFCGWATPVETQEDQ